MKSTKEEQRPLSKSKNAEVPKPSNELSTKA